MLTAPQAAQDPLAPGADAIVAHEITKRFPGVLANDRVEFHVRAGEVHALLGENGAGKTTLSRILSGMDHPDEGELWLYGRPVSFRSPRDAIDLGVCMVHQHFRLVERFTVAENVVLGDTRGIGRTFSFHPRAVERHVQLLAERYGLAVDPRAHVWELSVGEQQRVEILKTLYREARVLILDEPTSVLTPLEASALFTSLRQMAEDGRAVVFISHKLHEVMSVSDRVTVLRAGRTVATVKTYDATPRSLASLMIGRDLEASAYHGRTDDAAEPGLELEDVWVENDRGLPAVKGASLSVHAGEIVAVAGVAGNGQSELAEAIAGLRPPARGSIVVAGQRLHGGDPREAIAAGIGFVPEDRLGTGVAPGLSIAMNLALKSYRSDSTGPLLRLDRMRARAVASIEDYDVKAPGPDTAAGSLSGGNVQKLVLAREFTGAPKVLLAASPTRGLDVSAVEAVHAHIVEAIRRGVAVLLISEDLDEILALNDRILVMYEGVLTEAPRDDLETIGLLMAGESSQSA